jgi:alpha/beta superfamily hydrolase
VYLQRELPEHDIVQVNYDSHQALQESLVQVKKQLPKNDSFAIVGHSLGGVIGSIISAESDAVERLVTISSPLGGSKAANIVRWIPGHPVVMADITPSSLYIEKIQTSPPKVPVLSIISTGGHLNTMAEPNDSIVTVASQKAMKVGKKVEVKANHFEVLMHEKTVEQVRKHLFGEAQ